MSAAARLDGATDDEALAMLTRCCGASRWARAMLARRPFGTDEALFRAADEAWAEMAREDVLEALAHHPRIGADRGELRKKYGTTADWAASEQSGAAAANEETLRALRDGNARYDARFGHVFVVCATGKSAAEMLALLEARLDHEPEAELRIAAAEQAKITRIRLEKLA
ncbi:MAG: 2-oxo-4-hydroxy-4-carboxy-5-ureidoimidazoline decarboxylase [Myxococcota bacterium]|nr:2-oxo-4-hydroxy-4-carboxy-5-ureidoimidazoline decarboxylase [Myxococcota bacterium]